MWCLLVLTGCEGEIVLDPNGGDPRVPSDGGSRRIDAGPTERPDAQVRGADAGGGVIGGSDAGTPRLDAGSSTDPLGACAGTEAECLAARVINEYRAGHSHAGECSEPLRWNAELGRLAHEHQSGPFVRHSSHGFVENVGQAYGVRETAEYIVQWEAGIEEHCGADGSYTVSHHCATMFCNNRTVGVGVYEDGSTTYMTMMFGDEAGQPSW